MTDDTLILIQLILTFFLFCLFFQNSMNLPPDKARLLRQYDNEKKWELICDQVGTYHVSSGWAKSTHPHAEVSWTRHRYLVVAPKSMCKFPTAIYLHCVTVHLLFFYPRDVLSQCVWRDQHHALVTGLYPISLCWFLHTALTSLVKWVKRRSREHASLGQLKKLVCQHYRTCKQYQRVGCSSSVPLSPQPPCRWVCLHHRAVEGKKETRSKPAPTQTALKVTDLEVSGDRESSTGCWPADTDPLSLCSGLKFLCQTWSENTVVGSLHCQWCSWQEPLHFILSGYVRVQTSNSTDKLFPQYLHSSVFPTSLYPWQHQQLWKWGIFWVMATANLFP